MSSSPPSRYRKLLLATSNAGKLREVRQLLRGMPAELVDLTAFGDLSAPEETGTTFMENATIKALHYAGRTGCWAIADDSGLEVDALGGAPGVRSSRYAGPGASDTANNAKLIRALSLTAPEDRTARFRCAVVLASPTEVLASAVGTVEGHIIDEPRGLNGFGYDPHFLLTELGLTAAEIAAARKNRISHRGRAIAALLAGPAGAEWRRRFGSVSG